MKRNILSILLKSFIVLVAISFVACHDDRVDTFIKSPRSPIVFGATIHETGEVRMRGDDSNSISGSGLDSSYIASDFYNMDFFIQLCCNDGSATHKEIGIYQIPSGYEGQLEAKDANHALNWYNIDSPHTFYAWNIPWDKELTYENDNLKETKVIFHNSSEEDGFQEHHNNAILEYFIGAKSAEPYSYKEHGKYVDLTFHHLVSKIKIGSLILIKTDGSIQENLKADITFVGMPTAATFYPHPDDDGRPRVVYDPDKVDPDNGVTYYIDNNATTEDVFYICPEVNFSTIDFKVKLNSIDYVNYDTYYGTFEDVEFKRVPGSAYDQGPEKDSKILHAGEVMTLNIVLIPGIGPGLSIVVSDWSTDEPTESQYHNYPGLYSDTELADLLNAFCNQKREGQGGTTPEEIERLFEMYGEERDIDGDGELEKVFSLYDNVSTSSNIFPIPKDYILDGMGHTITMKTNRGVFTGNPPYFNIGPARNVYLRDEEGNTIYIDSRGYVWTYNNETREYVPTEYYLEPLTDNFKSYDINCVTGEVRRSTYYNNNITS